MYLVYCFNFVPNVIIIIIFIYLKVTRKARLPTELAIDKIAKMKMKKTHKIVKSIITSDNALIHSLCHSLPLLPFVLF